MNCSSVSKNRAARPNRRIPQTGLRFFLFLLFLFSFLLFFSFSGKRKEAKEKVAKPVWQREPRRKCLCFLSVPGFLFSLSFLFFFWKKKRTKRKSRDTGVTEGALPDMPLFFRPFATFFLVLFLSRKKKNGKKENPDPKGSGAGNRHFSSTAVDFLLPPFLSRKKRRAGKKSRQENKKVNFL